MHARTRMLIGLAAIALAGGCHSATQVIEEPRVDLDLTPSSGNRGFLVGSPTTAGEQDASREMIQTTIELPSFYKAKSRGAAPTIVTTGPEPEAVIEDTTAFTDALPATTSDLPTGAVDTYVVQKGDTLWTIAAKPEIYGDAGKWRWLYEANRDQLSSPDRLKAGMTLKVPRSQPESQAPLSGKDAPTPAKDEGTTFTK